MGEKTNQPGEDWHKVPNFARVSLFWTRGRAARTREDTGHVAADQWRIWGFGFQRLFKSL